MKLEVYHSDGTYALYVDGALDRGPTEEYLIVERIYQLLGIDDIVDSAFLYAGPAAGPALYVDEIHAYIAERERRDKEADELERQAAELRGRASQLRN